MSNENKPTINEHFVPQFYLRNFAFDGKHLYQYDILSGKSFISPVSIKSICYEKNLYEFKSEDGHYINRNLIENSLSRYEELFAKTIRKIQLKAQYNANLITKCFLTEQEKAILTLLIATMVLRNPYNINRLITTAQKEFDDITDVVMAKNLILQKCLPLYKKIAEEESSVFETLLDLLDNMSFQICKSDKKLFFTSDNPACLSATINPRKIHSITLPLSPCLALCMKPYEETEKELYNRLVNFRRIDGFNSSIIRLSNRWIYSNEPFTPRQIRMINRIRKEANYDLL